MAVRPDPEVGYRRPGDHRRADGLVERRVFVQASPADRLGHAARSDGRPLDVPGTAVRPRRAVVAGGGHDPAGTRPPRASCARMPGSRASRRGRIRASGCAITGSGFDSEWSWTLEPVAGGTRVVHAATFEPYDRWTGILVRLGRRVAEQPVEAHLRALKERAGGDRALDQPGVERRHDRLTRRPPRFVAFSID